MLVSIWYVANKSSSLLNVSHNSHILNMFVNVLHKICNIWWWLEGGKIVWSEPETRLSVCTCRSAPGPAGSTHGSVAQFSLDISRSRRQWDSDNIDNSDQTTTSEPEILNIPGPNSFVCFYLILEQQPAVFQIIYSLYKYCSNISLIEILNQF